MYASIDPAIVSYLAAMGVADERVYPQVLPQGATLPAVVYQRVDTTVTQPHGEPATLPRPRYQFTCWASTFEGARQTADEVLAALDGFWGTMGNGKEYEVEVESALLKDVRDYYDPDTELWNRQLDFQIMHKE